MKRIVASLLVLVVISTSCVSNKKYVALEKKYNDTKGSLQKAQFEKQRLEAKFAKIEKRVDNYNQKLNSLRELSGSLEKDNANLRNQNDIKLDMVNGTVISNSMRRKMQETLSKVDPSVLANARTLKDSMNIAVAYNLKKAVNTSQLENSDDIDINIDKTVVMISVADNLLFNTASYKVKRKAYKLIKQLANVINSEPSMDVMIEGHTDSRSISNAVVQDNWDLSVKRATSIVRILEKKYGVQPSRLIASGRGSSMPLYENNTKENRAKNRRTRIVILPNLDKFFGMLSQSEEIRP